MKRILIIAVITMATSALALGQTTDKKAARSSNVEQELIKLDKEWTEANVRGDTATLDRIFADDYTVTNVQGEVLTKAQAIANLKSGVNKTESSTPDNYTLRVYGDTAVMTHRSTTKGQYKGQDASGQHRSIHVFVKRGGRWQVVANQSTRIPQQ